MGTTKYPLINVARTEKLETWYGWQHPAILRKKGHAVWLTGSPEEAKAVLRPYPSERIEAWQVNRRLYATKTPDGASLIAPVSQ